MKSKNRSAIILHVLFMLMLGIVLGIAGKLADAHTEHISNILSGISFWIMLCTFISVTSCSPWRAAAYVFVLCASMVAAYYLTAAFFGLYYSATFAYGWAAFALFSPVLGFVAWHARKRGKLAAILACGILAAMLVGTHVLFKIRVYDIIFVIVTAFILFRRRKA